MTTSTTPAAPTAPIRAGWAPGGRAEDDDAYPRPQLRRTGWVLLDGPWSFLEDAADRGVDLRLFDAGSDWGAADTITVPFPPESTASGIGRDVANVLWYRRDLGPIDIPADQRVLLHFEAVDYHAHVWLNGQYLGFHEGGQARFSFDITQSLSPRGVNILTVRSYDDAEDLEQPRGKQDWQAEPHAIWYRRTSGIWRSVWLEHVPRTHVSRLGLAVAADDSVETTVEVTGPWDGIDVELVFSFGGRTLSRSRHQLLGATLTTRVHLVDPQLHIEPNDLRWAPEHPHLIDVEVVVARGADRVDHVTSYLGLRTVGVDDRHFILNGHPYFLRMVLEQGYWPATHLAAPSPKALRAEAELIKDLGFNGLRVHQKVADPRFLYECDRLGLVVWADTAASYAFSPRSLRRLTQEWFEIVERDRNHPCVVAWVPYNESWGVAHLEHNAAQRSAVAGVHALLKALDPTRVVLGNDGWEYVAGDVVGIHDYTHDPAALRGRFGSLEAARNTVRTERSGGRRLLLAGHGDGPRRPMVLTEFGGINLHNGDEAWSGYGDAEDEQDFLSQLSALVAATLSSGLAGYCYTQFTDTLQEQNGLTSADRVPKVPIESLRAIFGRP